LKLSLFREIRNEFAHSLEPEMSFSSLKVRALVDTLTLSVTTFFGGKKRPPKREFESAFLVMLGFLLGHLDHVTRIEESPDIVDAVIRGVRSTMERSEH